MAIFHSYVSLPEGKYLGNHSLCLAPVFLFGESGGRKAKVPMNCWPWNSQGESLKLSKVLYAFRWICCQYWKWLTYIIGLYLPRTKHCQTMWLRDSKISKSFSHETVKRVLDTIRSSTNVDPHEKTSEHLSLRERPLDFFWPYWGGVLVISPRTSSVWFTETWMSSLAL